MFSTLFQSNRRARMIRGLLSRRFAGVGLPPPRCTRSIILDMLVGSMFMMGAKVPFTIICYHTTNRMLFQLLGEKSDSKVRGLTQFMNQILKENIETVERTQLHSAVKETMQAELTKMLEDSSTGFRTCEDTSQNSTVVKQIEDGGECEEPQTLKGPTTAAKPEEVDGISKSDEKMESEEEETNIQEVGRAKQLQQLISDLRVKLDTERKERVKVERENEQLVKKCKDVEGKEKTIKTLKEKLEKNIKMKDQMSAAVQTLKQECQVAKDQTETHIDSWKS